MQFKCCNCQKYFEAELIGSEIKCSICYAQNKVPLHIFCFNPYKRPIQKFISDICSIKWIYPYFPQLIELVVLIFIITIMFILYLTVGLASQVAGIFQSLILDATSQIKGGSFVEKSAYAVAVGIYIILWLPFWIILLPFWIFGWLWNHFSYFGIIFVLIIGLIVAYFIINPNFFQYVLSYYNLKVW